MSRPATEAGRALLMETADAVDRHGDAFGPDELLNATLAIEAEAQSALLARVEGLPVIDYGEGPGIWSYRAAVLDLLSGTERPAAGDET